MKRFLSMLATGAAAAMLALGLSATAHAQLTRPFGAGALVLDDHQAPPHTLAIETPQFPSAEWTAWAAGGFQNLFILPVPPTAGAQAGFIFPGPLSGSIVPEIAYWVPPGQNGFNNNGGFTGAWDHATKAQLNIPTITGVGLNIIPKGDGANGLVASMAQDDGTTFQINTTTPVFTVDDATGNTAVFGTLTVGGATQINNTLDVTGVSTTNGITDAGGITTTTLGTSSDITDGGALTVTGASTLNGATQVNNTLGVTGATTTNGITNTGAISTGTMDASGGISVASGAAADAANTIQWESGNNGTLTTAALSPAQTWTLPNASGTISLGGITNGTTNNSTLRWDAGSNAWLENTGVLADNTSDLQVNGTLTSNGNSNIGNGSGLTNAFGSGGGLTTNTFGDNNAGGTNKFGDENASGTNNFGSIWNSAVAGGTNWFGYSNSTTGAMTNNFGTAGGATNVINNFGNALALGDDVSNTIGSTVSGSVVINDMEGQNGFGAANSIGTANVTNNATSIGNASSTLTLTGGSTWGVTNAGAATFTSLNNSGGGITNAGAISGATGITSSGTITFSGLTAQPGVVHNDAGGVLSSSAIVNGDLTNGAYSNITGLGAQSQALDMNSNQINNLADPTLGTDAANLNTVNTAVNTAVTGTTNTLAIFTAAHVVGNSGITETGGIIHSNDAIELGDASHQGILRLYNGGGSDVTIAPNGANILDVNNSFQADGNINANTGGILTAGVTRIDNSGNGTLGTLSTSGLATLNSASVTTTLGVTGATTTNGITNTGAISTGTMDASGGISVASGAAADAANTIQWESGNNGTLTTAALSPAQTWTLPNASGTISLGGLTNGTTTNSTLRWDGTKWAENTGVLADATNDLAVSGKVGIGQLPGADALDVTGNSVLTGTLQVTGSTYLATTSPGQVGVGLTNPFGSDELSNTATNTVGSDNLGNAGTAGSFAWVSGDVGYTGTFYNPGTSAGADGVEIKVAGNAASNIALDVSQNAAQATQGTALFQVEGSGAVNVPNGLLTTGAGIANTGTITSTSDISTSAGNITSSGTVTAGTGLTVTSGGATISGGASISGGLNNNAGGITSAGAISGATGITSSGTITFSGLTAQPGIVHNDAGGVLSSSGIAVGDITPGGSNTFLNTDNSGNVGWNALNVDGTTLQGNGSSGGTALAINLDHSNTWTNLQTIAPSVSHSTAASLIVEAASAPANYIFAVTQNGFVGPQGKYLSVSKLGQVDVGDGGVAGQLNLHTGASNQMTSLTTAATAVRNVAFPDAGGNVALTTSGGTALFIGPLTGNTYNYTLPTSSVALMYNTEAAGGDLSGTYPNPTVAQVNGVAYPSGPSTNTVPVVTAANTVTYEAVPNAALANSTIGLTSTNGTLTVPATLTLGDASDNIQIDLTHANTWTGNQLLPANSTQGDNLVSSVNAGTTAIGVTHGGTGTTTAPTLNGVIYASSASQYASTAQGAAGTVLHGNAGVPSFSAVVNGDLTNGAYSNITGLGAQSQALNMNSQLINNLANPVAGTDAANLNTVNTAVTNAVTTGTVGQLAIYTGANSVGSINLSGDVTTTNSAVTTVGKVNGVAYPSGPSTNTVPVVTAANTVTYEAVPNAALANSTIGLTSTNGTLTVPATLTLGDASDNIQIDLTHANTWTGEQTFSAAGTGIDVTTPALTTGVTNTGAFTTSGGTATINSAANNTIIGNGTGTTSITGSGWGVTNAGAATFTSVNAGAGAITTTGNGSFGTLSTSGLATLNSASVTTTLGVTGLTSTNGGLTNTGAFTTSGGAASINASTAFGTTIGNGTNAVTVTGDVAVNTGASTGTTTIGNASSTTAITGPTNINIGGSNVTTIGNASSATDINGVANTTGIVNTGTIGSSGNVTLGNSANLTVTAGNITDNSGNLTLSSGSLTITSGNAGITGTLSLVGAGSPLSVNGSVGTLGQVLISGGANTTPSWTSTLTGITVPFTQITAGTNSGQALVVGSGSTLTASGGGLIEGAIANATITNSSIGSVSPSTGAFTTLSSSGLATLNSASVTTTLGVTGLTTTSGGITNNNAGIAATGAVSGVTTMAGTFAGVYTATGTGALQDFPIAYAPLTASSTVIVTTEQGSTPGDYYTPYLLSTTAGTGFTVHLSGAPTNGETVKIHWIVIN